MAGRLPDALQHALVERGLEPCSDLGEVRAFPAVVVLQSADKELPSLRRLRSALGRRARIFLVVPAGRAIDALHALRVHGLEPKRMNLLHPDLESPPTDAIIVATCAKPGGLVVSADMRRQADAAVRNGAR